MSEPAKRIAVFSGTTDRTAKYAHDEQLRDLAVRLVKRFPERLGSVVPDRIAFLSNANDKPGKGGRPVFARCRRLGAREEFLTQSPGRQGIEHVIEVYAKNCAELAPNQQALLLYHELLHIGEEGRIQGHDVEEFGEIVDTFGRQVLDYQRNDLPDILDETFEWRLRRPTLFDAKLSGEAVEPACP